MPRARLIGNGLNMGGLSPAGGGGTPYLQRDEFTSGDTTSPRASVPGPGSIVFTNQGTQMSVAGGKLVQIGGAGTPIETGTPQTRTDGLAFLVKTKITAGSELIGWGTNAAGSAPKDLLLLNFASAQFAFANGTLVSGLATGLGNKDIQVAVIERSVGAHVLVSDSANFGTYPTMTRLWVSNAGTDTPMYPMLAANSVSAALTYDDFTVTTLGGIWNTLYGPATARSATPTDGTTLTGDADMWAEFTWTPVAAEVMTFMFRRTDDNNCMKLVCDQAGGTIKLYKTVAGVDTELDAGKTQTFTAGTPYRIIVITDVNAILTYVNTTAKHNTSDSANASATGLKVSGFTTGTNLISWPRRCQISLPFEPAAPAAAAPYTFASFGDSVSWVGKWQPILTGLLDTATGQSWSEVARIAQSGEEVITMSGTIDSRLAAIESVQPAYILCYCGVNDVNHQPLPTQSAFITAYQYIVDKMHVKWPSALIYLMKVYAGDFPADADTLDGWIDTVLASRTFLRDGGDARLFLPGNTVDNTHPTDPDGYALMADAFKVAMGF